MKYTQMQENKSSRRRVLHTRESDLMGVCDLILLLARSHSAWVGLPGLTEGISADWAIPTLPVDSPLSIHTPVYFSNTLEAKNPPFNTLRNIITIV